MLLLFCASLSDNCAASMLLHAPLCPMPLPCLPCTAPAPACRAPRCGCTSPPLRPCCPTSCPSRAPCLPWMPSLWPTHPQRKRCTGKLGRDSCCMFWPGLAWPGLLLECSAVATPAAAACCLMAMLLLASPLCQPCHVCFLPALQGVGGGGAPLAPGPGAGERAAGAGPRQGRRLHRRLHPLRGAGARLPHKVQVRSGWVGGWMGGCPG